MRIGISFTRRPNQSLWDDRLSQQTLFLAVLMRSLPQVEDVILITDDVQPALFDEALSPDFSFPLVPIRDAMDLVDIVIEMETYLAIKWLDQFRSLGKRVIRFCCRQPYASLTEPTSCGRSRPFGRPDRCDEVWISTKDRKFAPMLRTMHRCPVYEMPILWDSTFIQARVTTLAKLGFGFGYQPRRAVMHGGVSHRLRHAEPWRVVVWADSENVSQPCTIPVLICDAAYRASNNTLAEMHVLDSAHLVQHRTVDGLLRQLAVAATGKIRFAGHYDLPHYLALHADAVVAHHWQDEQEAVYLDALYGGYPLIHNATWLDGNGYFYPEFSIDEGAKQLLHAAVHHDAQHDHYASRARRFLSTLSPRSEKNQAPYAQRLAVTRPRCLTNELAGRCSVSAG